MRLVNNVSGSAAIIAPSDDVAPIDGVLQSDLADYVSRRYQFAGRPDLPPDITVPVMTFQGGKLIDGGNTYPIFNIGLFSDGDAVTCANTDDADHVLNDLLNGLSTDLKYRYGEGLWKRAYASAIVVDLDAPLEDRIPAFREIDRIVSNAVERDAPFRPRAIAFGHGEVLTAFKSAADHLQLDFTIQRRVGSSFDMNRYFCSGPLRTADLLRAMERIEQAIAAN